MARTNVHGYYASMQEYNRLVPLVHDTCGEEAKRLFTRMSMRDIDPTKATPRSMAILAELATSRLAVLASYLQSKLDTSDRQVLAVYDLVLSMLRESLFEKPRKENDIQNALEIIFRARKLDYRRGKTSIEYSSKRFIPDFTFDSLNMALEVKFVDSESKEKVIIEGINADIPAYQTKYRWIIFVVYDLGFIRDEQLFKSSIESNPAVYVLVRKH